MHVRIPKELDKAVKKLAARKFTSASKQVEIALRQYLAKEVK